MPALGSNAALTVLDVEANAIKDEGVSITVAVFEPDTAPLSSVYAEQIASTPTSVFSGGSSNTQASDKAIID